MVVGLGEGLGELDAEKQGLRHRQGAAAHALGQGLARHELLRDEEPGLGAALRGRLARLEDGGDTGMRQDRGRARLPEEALAGLRVAGLLRADELQGHLAPEDAVARPIDDTHAAAAEPAEHVEVGYRAWLHGGPWCLSRMLAETAAVDAPERLRARGLSAPGPRGLTEVARPW